MNKNKKIGENITKFRKAKGLTMPALADKCGVSKGYLSFLENGEKDNPSIDILDKIATHLNVTIGDLIGQEILHGKPISKINNISPELAKYIKKMQKKGITIDDDIVASLSQLKKRGDSEPDWNMLYKFIKSSLKNEE